MLTYAEETCSHHPEHLLAQLEGVVDLNQLPDEQHRRDSAQKEASPLIYVWQCM